jgi:NADPH:quinone reductase-like Zn-dependent oxidoreductase
MKAVVVTELGVVPSVTDVPDVRAEAEAGVARVLAGGLNALDLHFASGYYAGIPVPHVVGREGIAELDGRRVYFTAAGPPSGSLVERAAIPANAAYPLPDAVGNGDAIAVGASGLTALLALREGGRLRADESVLVLGASGAVGQLAVQVARALGARRVAAAARDVRAIPAAADTTVEIGDDLEDALVAVSHGGFDVVLDPLGGRPLAAAVAATADGGRIVTVGISAGDPISPIPTRKLQGRTLVGHSTFLFGHDVKRSAYEQLLGWVQSGQIRPKVECFPLASLEAAWAAQERGPHGKIVIEMVEP